MMELWKNIPHLTCFFPHHCFDVVCICFLAYDGGDGDGVNDSMWLLLCKFIVDSFILWACRACNYNRAIVGTQRNETKQNNSETFRKPQIETAKQLRVVPFVDMLLEPLLQFVW
jgi:hypothetical protein